MDIIKTIKNKLWGTHIKPYLSARQMPLYNYEQFLETNDKKWFSNYYEVKIPFNEPLDLDLAMQNVYGEILEITQDYDIIKKFNNIHKLHKLELKYNTCLQIITAIENMPFAMPTLQPLIDELKKWHYRIDPKKELFGQILTIKNGLKNIFNEMSNIKKEIEKENKSEKLDLEKDKVVIELGLELRYPIQSKETTVYKYFTLRKQLSEKIKLQQNGRN